MKRALLIVGLSLIIMNSAQAAYTWYIYDGHEYALTETQTSWADAQAEAQSVGGNLVTINDAAENQWLTDTFHATSVVTDPITQHWIGLYPTENPIVAPYDDNWAWVDGTPVSYTNWHPVQPDGPIQGYPGLWGTLLGPGTYGLHPTNTLGFWNDASSGSTWLGIIERPAIVPAPGAVLLVGIGTGIMAWVRRKSLLG